MSFIHLAFLGFSALIVLPILIHLIRSHQYRPADLGTLRFLRQAMEETSARRHIANWLLLLLRILAVLAAVFAFARPFLGAKNDPAQGETHILVDASGSMNARQGGVRLFELAMRRAKKLCEAASAQGATVHLWLCTDAAVEIAPEKIGELTGQKTPAGSLDWAANFRKITASAAKASKGRPVNAVVITDLQRGDLPRPSAENTSTAASPAIAPTAWPQGSFVRVEALAAPAWDTEVAGLSWGSQTGTGTDLRVDLATYGAPPSGERKLAAFVGDAKVAEAPVTLAPGASALHLSIPAQPAGAPPVEVRLVSGDASADALPEDDHLWIPVPDTRPIPVHLTGWAFVSRYDSEDYYPAKALEVIPTDTKVAAFAPAHVELPDLARTATDPRGVVLMGDCGQKEVAALKTLVPKIKEGMGVVIFLGDRATDTACAKLVESGLLPAAPKMLPSVAEGAIPARLPIAWWDVTEPNLSRYSLDRLDLSALRLIPRHDLTPVVAAGAKPLMKFSGDAPAAVAVSCGKGRVLLVAGKPTRRDGDWVIQRIFAPWLRDTVAAVAAKTRAGNDWTVALRRLDDEAGFGPDAAHKKILRFPQGEGDTAGASAEEFAAAFHLPTAEPNKDAAPGTLPPGAGRTGELWPWILLALLVILGVEILVADRRKN